MIDTTIVICYKKGTASMLDVCLASVYRHTEAFKVVVVSTEDDDNLIPLRNEFDFDHEVKDIKGVTRHNIHGAMLDTVIPDSIGTEYVMTLDSDCFPIADDWLKDLKGMIEGGADISGIRYPWSSPPESLPKKSLEWRLRSQLSRDSVWVACQLVKVKTLKELGRRYNDGDDTGLAILKEARDRGLKLDGFMATGYAKSIPCVSDDEFNTEVCVVYGDKVYHHGGHTRNQIGDKRPYCKGREWVEPMVMEHRGAEFLLNGQNLHCYRFDKVEEVTKERISRAFGFNGDKLR